jgi:hypothetical protein
LQPAVDARAAAPLREPVTVARRGVVALSLLLALLVVWTLLGLAGIAPLPRSIATLADADKPGHGHALVSGYYIAQPFMSLGGASLPPYAFAESTNAGAKSVRVLPTLRDLSAGRVAGIIDTATGDGSRWSPYVIHTVSSFQTFVTAAAVGLLVLLTLAWLSAGPLTARFSAVGNRD